MKLVALALTLTLTAVPTLAQTTFTDPANLGGERVKPSDGRELPIDQNASGLAQLLRKLKTRASILNIVAHPDDEDGGMLTTYARGFGARVADLSLTRGEGGQNAVTGDFEDALGLLRTQELLANDRYVGVDQMFGTEVDFGFSKTKAEAFAKWTHQRVLYDAVRAIRIYRPLVITSTWTGNVTDGHGQHQVSGQIAQEAFVAAGDPTVFPELTAEGILPWQPLRIFARVPMQAITPKGLYDYATNQYVPATFTNYVTGVTSTTPPSTDVTVHEGTPDPLITPAGANPADLPPSLASKAPDAPLSYIQFARIGLGLQKSQIGPGFRNAPSGAFDVAYHLFGSRTPTSPQASRQQAVSQGSRSEKISEPPQHLPNPFKTVGFSPQGMPSTAAADPNFFTGIDTSILSIQNLAPEAFPPDTLSSIAEDIQNATVRFDPAHPEKIAPTLAAALKLMDQLISEVEQGQGDLTARASALHELRIKRTQLNDALVLSLGINASATVDSRTVVSNTPLQVHLSLSVSGKELPSDFILVVAPGGALEKAVPCPASEEQPHIGTPQPWTQPIARKCMAPPSQTAITTRPYFTRADVEQPVYQLLDPQLRNAPSAPPALVMLGELHFQSVQLTLDRIVREGLQPISIVPPVSIASSPSATVFSSGQPDADLTAHLSNDGVTSANINVQSPQNWKITASAHNRNDSVNFYLHPTAPIVGPQLFHVTAQTPDHHIYAEGYRAVGYPGLINTNFYTPAITRVVPVDLNLPQHVRIAYLPGTGDNVPQALASINLTPTILTIADLTPTTLAQYDTVILGVRAYAAHPDLHGAPTQALLDYARNGGNVVVQYQTAEFTAADAPYPLDLGANEKVVDETAPVKLLVPGTNGSSEASASGLTASQGEGSLPPGDALLTTPNRITPADFNNWIEERGHGFLETWDPHYTALTETHDPGAPSEHVAPQLPQRGGLITTPLGSPSGKQGRWTYCAFALYRQLPEAVPGAYRLFINLITPPTP